MRWVTDAADAQAGAAFLRMLRLIPELERTGRWREEGARDVTHLLAVRYGISAWKAHRMVAAAHALPRLARALASGLLGPEEVLEGHPVPLARVRATVVLHARVGAEEHPAEIEQGGLCHPAPAPSTTGSCTSTAGG